MNNCELDGWENITLSTDPNNPTIMDYDGFIRAGFNTFGAGGDGSQFHIYINGVDFLDAYIVSSTYNFTASQSLAISKGDSVYCSFTRLTAGSFKSLGNYYKKRDYSNR